MSPFGPVRSGYRCGDLGYAILLLGLIIFSGVLIASKNSAAQNTDGVTRNHAEALAPLVSKPVYDLDEEQIQFIVSNYMSGNQDIVAVHVTENLEDQTLLLLSRDADGLSVSSLSDIPDLASVVVVASETTYRDEVVGKVDVYMLPESTIALTLREAAWLAENPTISVGVEAWYPFVGVGPDGGVDGVAGDFLDIITKRTGLQLNVIADVWPSLLAGFRSGKVDLLPATYFTQERAEYGLYTEPYFTGREFLYVAENRTDIGSFADLNGKKLAIPRDFGTIPKIQEAYPEIEIVLTDDQLQSINFVLEGRVDATFEQQIVMEQLLLKELITGIRAVPQSSFEASGLYFFVNGNKPVLHSILNKALNSIDEAERRKIVARWLLQDFSDPQVNPSAPTTSEDDNASILLVLGAVSIGLLATSLLAFSILGRTDRFSNFSTVFGSTAFRTLILIGLSFLVGVVAVMNWVAIEGNRDRTKEKINRELQIVLNLSIDRIESWVRDKRGFLRQLGRDQTLVSLTRELVGLRDNIELLRSSATLKRAADYLAQSEQLESETYFIVAPDNTTLLSSSMEHIGEPSAVALINADYFTQVYKGEAVFIPPVPSQIANGDGGSTNQASTVEPGSMFFATPITDSSGAVIAVFCKVVSAAGSLSGNLRLSRVGDSGETYLVSLEAKMLTESRFKDDLAELGFQQSQSSGLIDIDIREPGEDFATGVPPSTPASERPLTRMMQGILTLEANQLGYSFDVNDKIETTRHPSNVEGYSDYRGIQVVGAWAWLEDLGVGITSELDYDEAYADFDLFRQNLILISSITTLLAIAATLITLLLGQRATRSLKLARDQLEDRVAERTQELQDQRGQLLNILETSHFGVSIVSLKSNQRIYVNTAMLELFGFNSMDEFLATPIKETFADERDLEKLRATGNQGFVNEAIVERVRRDGTLWWCMTTRQMIEHNGEDALMVWHYDVTERKESEDRLRSAYSVISDSVSYATNIQMAMLGGNDVMSAVLADHLIIWEPRDKVGGDFYWCHVWGDGVLIILADCTGHGVPGAFMTLIASGALDKAMGEVQSGNVGALLTRMHQIIQSSLGQQVRSGLSDDGLDLGACYIDEDITELRFAGAHFPLFIVENGSVEEIRGDRSSIGYRGIEQSRSFQQHLVKLAPGQVFVMTSDGFLDQVGGHRRRMFGKKRFKALLSELAAGELHLQEHVFKEALATYQGSEIRRDDVSLVAFQPR